METIGKIGSLPEVLDEVAPSRKNTAAGILMPAKMMAGDTREMQAMEGNEREGKRGRSLSFHWNGWWLAGAAADGSNDGGNNNGLK